MSQEWITDRLPTYDDLDNQGNIWNAEGALVYLDELKDGDAWMKTNRPKPYVEPKRLTFIKSLTIPHDGDVWLIIGKGAMRDGKVYCHLASTTKGVQKRNGWNPVQIGDWIDADLVMSCAIHREELAAIYEEVKP